MHTSLYVYIHVYISEFPSSWWGPRREEGGIQYWVAWLWRVAWTVVWFLHLRVRPCCMWHLTRHPWKGPLNAGSQWKYLGKITQVSPGDWTHVRIGKNTICMNEAIGTKCMKNYWHLMDVDVIFSYVKCPSTCSRVCVWVCSHVKSWLKLIGEFNLWQWKLFSIVPSYLKNKLGVFLFSWIMFNLYKNIHICSIGFWG